MASTAQTWSANPASLAGVLDASDARGRRGSTGSIDHPAEAAFALASWCGIEQRLQAHLPMMIRWAA
jgi:hypothetical protein